MKIAVIHGPNLRSLGKREPEVYGTDTLEDINDHLQKMANELGVEITVFQSNHEGELIDYIERMAPEVEGFLINRLDWGASPPRLIITKIKLA